ncbi:MAG: DUF1559 domain-containing protein, partial [Phycisphaerales bacterium]|nr:DUF1559 domain-containing protein [Phycisphaerales bacterium]
MRRARFAPRGFSLIDVLVSVVVIGILIGLLLPTVSHVRESARRIVCQSNLRQIGMGLAQYADVWDDQLAPSSFAATGTALTSNSRTELAEMMTLRLAAAGEEQRLSWDGLGLLYFDQFLPAPEIFYCPSHYGNHSFSDYRESWRINGPSLVGNFHYRGMGPNGATRLRSVEPIRAALVTDGLRTTRDINHRTGMNVLRADLSISWYSDLQGNIASLLAASGGAEEPSTNLVMSQIWHKID